eukprot:TRINITY_DN2667_c0_g1_i2.p1 TRINITY_DN2667_c0_g1~~TRINITY_DN2667_c0_g1_i2.p1  ORF type:complete len:305 (-),score=33.57 TRINITY_DN2667_c0_g1_i2:177-1070(-)
MAHLHLTNVPLTAFPRYSQHPPPTLVLYHAHCPDGFGAAFASWQVLGESARYLPCSYGEAPPDVTGESVLVADFSFSPAQIQRMRESATAFVLLDHHKSAMKELAHEAGCYFHLGKSGARLAWEYCQPAVPVPPLIAYVEDRDLWTWKLPQSVEFNLGLDARPRTFAAWAQCLESTEVTRLIAAGSAIRSYRDTLVARLAKSAVTRRWQGLRVLVVNTALLVSETGNVLASRPSCDVALLWHFTAPPREFSVSLRSSGDDAPDVGALAKLYGGGGHPRAAGFSYSGASIEELFEEAT